MPPNPNLPVDLNPFPIRFPYQIEKPEKVIGPVIGTKKIIVLLVDFPDHPSIFSKTNFDTILFTRNGNSLTDYYFEVSYNKLTLTGEVSGWFRVKNNYAFYTGDSFGIKPYPNNSQKLVEDVVSFADEQIDFSQFDENRDGFVDNLFIVHSGPGAEETQNKSDIWSHKWQLSDAGGPGAYQTQDGVKVDLYTMQPERFSDSSLITIGVFAHEFGHLLGLPDLYDTDYSSEGLGNFCLMAAGSWLDRGRRPAHPNVWCKYLLGWITPDSIERGSLEVLERAELPAIAHNPKAYRILSNPSGVDWSFDNRGQGEYFLVENRYKSGFDRELPGSGLLILHIDESREGNSNERAPLVGILQADRQPGYSLPKNNRGTANTLWKNDTLGVGPGTIPSTAFYGDSSTGVNIKNISPADSIMTVDLSIEPLFLGRVYSFPNPFIPQESQLKKVAIIYVPTDTAKLKNNYPDFEVKIFNLAGELVRTIPKDEVDRLRRVAFWDLKNNRKEEVASGLYFYIIEMAEDGIKERSKGRLTIIR